jgi:hypothetical protein
MRRLLSNLRLQSLSVQFAFDFRCGDDDGTKTAAFEHKPKTRNGGGNESDLFDYIIFR